MGRLQSDWRSGQDQWSPYIGNLDGDLWTDTPVGWKPPLGPSIPVNLGAPSRDADMPTLFNNVNWVWLHSGFATSFIPGGPSQNDIDRTLAMLGLVLMEQLIRVASSMDETTGTVDGLGDQLATQGLEAQLEANFAQQNAEAYADQVATTLVGDERAEREQDIQTVQQRATAQFNQAESNITQAEQNATDQFNQAQQEIQALQSGLQQEAQAREQGDQEQQQYADQQAQQAEQDAESHADLEVAAATAAAAAALAAEAAALEAEIAAVEAEVAGLVGLAGDAILGGALLTLIEDGLLFGFLAAAVKDPKQTADASVGALDPIMELAGGALDALIGWAA